MKMGIFFGNLFWGILLILWGLSLILKSFGIHLPLAKVFFAIIIILFGVKILVGGSFKSQNKGVYHKTVKGKSSEYTTLFASQKIDLTHLKPGDKPVEINVVFGSAYIVLPDDVAFKFLPTTVFGSLATPTHAHLGVSHNPQIINPDAAGESVLLEINTIFSRTEIVIQESSKPESEAAADSTAAEEGTF